jgi:hypothetical protein
VFFPSIIADRDGPASINRLPVPIRAIIEPASRPEPPAPIAVRLFSGF